MHYTSGSFKISQPYINTEEDQLILSAKALQKRILQHLKRQVFRSHSEKEIQIKKDNAKLLEHILKISDRKNKVAV